MLNKHTRTHTQAHQLCALSLLGLNGVTYMVPTEVVLMVKAAGGPEKTGKSVAVSFLDWYDLDDEILLVIIKQLLEATIQMHSEGVLHRGIKSENVLIETGSEIPRVQIIDFGCGCFVRKEPYLRASAPALHPSVDLWSDSSSCFVSFCLPLSVCLCIVLTLAHARPEHDMQGTHEVGPTAVLQLAALLYELVDGHKRFGTFKLLLAHQWAQETARCLQGKTILIVIACNTFISVFP